MAIRKPEESTRPLDSDILPYDDGQPMETSQHHFQMDLLTYPLRRYLKERAITAYVAGNNFLYYDKGPPPRFVGPDFYVVLGREDWGQKSYVVWEEEGRYPDVIVELLSESSEEKDRGEKFVLYRDTFRTPEYFLYDPLKQTFEGYRLGPRGYAPIPEVGGARECQTLGLKLQVRDGWLRWVTPAGEVLLTGEEWAEREAERARREAERARREAERARRAEEELRRLRERLGEADPSS